MSNSWRILVVEDEESLNWSIVNSLHRDGYLVQGVMSGAEAIRRLWSEEYDVVISDLKTPGADGFELLQWIRAYRPNVRVIMVAPFGSDVIRLQALEGGVVSYLEKPVDLHVLKEELRRLFQQTGFSANLESFDLLDVIQIITMSRKSIALVVSTGLEERGVLRFQNGELIWAEYGILRGEEAFFALAAYKNGTVMHQPWNEQITPNVTQPLSRLILQALQYRAKYAALNGAGEGWSAEGQTESQGHLAPVSAEQIGVMNSTPTGRGEVVTPLPIAQESEDDSPFVFGTELQAQVGEVKDEQEAAVDQASEWWQQSEKVPRLNSSGSIRATTEGSTRKPLPHFTSERSASRAANGNGGTITPSTVHKTPASRRTDLPSWLMDQPTQSELPALRPSSLSETVQVPTTPALPPGVSPATQTSSAEWQSVKPPLARTRVQPQRKHATGPQKASGPKQSTTEVSRQVGSAEWQLQEDEGLFSSPSGTLQSLTSSWMDNDSSPLPEHQHSNSLATIEAPAAEDNSKKPISPGERVQEDGLKQDSLSSSELQRVAKRNYPALVAALQTLGYSVPSFVATAIVSRDGQPIAQVAVDDLDISQMCKHLSNILQAALLSLDAAAWGSYEDTVITSSAYHILLRIVGSDREAFQVLITTREGDPVDSLEVMANVEGAIGAAL